MKILLGCLLFLYYQSASCSCTDRLDVRIKAIYWQDSEIKAVDVDNEFLEIQHMQWPSIFRTKVPVNLEVKEDVKVIANMPCGMIDSEQCFFLSDCVFDEDGSISAKLLLGPVRYGLFQTRIHKMKRRLKFCDVSDNEDCSYGIYDYLPKDGKLLVPAKYFFYKRQKADVRVKGNIAININDINDFYHISQPQLHLRDLRRNKMGQLSASISPCSESTSSRDNLSDHIQKCKGRKSKKTVRFRLGEANNRSLNDNSSGGGSKPKPGSQSDCVLGTRLSEALTAEASDHRSLNIISRVTAHLPSMSGAWVTFKQWFPTLGFGLAGSGLILKTLSRFRMEPELKTMARFLYYMGPVAIKLGQVMSGLKTIPEEERNYFKKLCTAAIPDDFSAVQKQVKEALLEIVSDSNRIELVKVDRKPLGVGSIAQVHRGIIKINGIQRECVFKVVKKGVEAEIKTSYQSVLAWLFWLDNRYGGIWRDLVFVMTGMGKHDYGEAFKKSILTGYLDALCQECDLRLEAENLERLYTDIYQQKVEGVTVPLVYGSNKNVLIMTFIKGETAEVLSEKTTSIDLIEKQRKVEKVWCQLVKKTKRFHGDLHIGNWMVEERSGRIVFLDCASISDVCISPVEFEAFEKKLSEAYLYYTKILSGEEDSGSGLTVRKSSKSGSTCQNNVTECGRYMKPELKRDIVNRLIDRMVLTPEFWDEMMAVDVVREIIEGILDTVSGEEYNRNKDAVKNADVVGTKGRVVMTGNLLIDKLAATPHFQKRFVNPYKEGFLFKTENTLLSSRNSNDVLHKNQQKTKKRTNGHYVKAKKDQVAGAEIEGGIPNGKGNENGLKAGCTDKINKKNSDFVARKQEAEVAKKDVEQEVDNAALLFSYLLDSEFIKSRREWLPLIRNHWWPASRYTPKDPKSYQQLREALLRWLPPPYTSQYSLADDHIASVIKKNFIKVVKWWGGGQKIPIGDFKKVREDVIAIFEAAYRQGVMVTNPRDFVVFFLDELIKKGYALPNSFVYYTQFTRRLKDMTK